MFPSECVHPVAAPDFLVLPPDRVEPRDRQRRVAASAAIAVAMGSAVAAHELDVSTEVLTGLNTSFKLNVCKEIWCLFSVSQYNEKKTPSDFSLNCTPILCYQLLFI